ncbi:MAG: response regulator [Opitutae bacterium]|nr:response regulator [Opitutae bacterium]
MYSHEYFFLIATLGWLLAALALGLVGGIVGAAAARTSHRWLTLFALLQAALFVCQGFDWDNRSLGEQPWRAFLHASSAWVLLEAARRIWNQRAPRRWPVEAMLPPALGACVLAGFGCAPTFFMAGNALAMSCACLVFVGAALWPTHYRAAPQAERIERLLLACGALTLGVTLLGLWYANPYKMARFWENGHVLAAAVWLAGGVMAGVLGTRVRPRLVVAVALTTLAVALGGGWLTRRIANEVTDRQRVAWQRQAESVATQLRDKETAPHLSDRPASDAIVTSVLDDALAADPTLLCATLWRDNGRRVVPLQWRARSAPFSPADTNFHPYVLDRFRAKAPFLVGPPAGDPGLRSGVMFPLRENEWLGLEFASEAWAVAVARGWFIGLGVLAALILTLAGGGLLLWREAITQARAVAEARRLAEEKARTEFLTFISHELRTPLQTILGRAELLASDPAAAAHAATIAAQGQLLLRLVNDLLDLGTLEAGKFALRPQPFSLRAVLDAVAEAERPAAAAKQLDLRVEIPAEVPDELAGDATRLRQILGNLLRNAVKFTAQGEVRLVVATEDAALDAARLIFRVLDTGPGLPPEKIPQLFTLYTRLDAGDSFVREGTGVGLALVRRLCEHMGGSVTAANRPDGGAEFTVLLTLPTAPAATLSGPAPALAAPLGATGPALAILVVEDNTAARELLAEALRRCGHDVETVADGAAALAACARRAFAAVVLDVNLPKIDGVAVARQLRALPNPPRLIGCSAEALASTRDAALAAGMDVFLEKPVRLAELAAALSPQRGGEANIFDVLNSPETVLRAAEILARERGELLAALEAAVEQKDAATLRQKAHYLHSTALLLRRADLADLCQQLGQQARAGDLTGAQQTVTALRAALASAGLQ